MDWFTLYVGVGIPLMLLAMGYGLMRYEWWSRSRSDQSRRLEIGRDTSRADALARLKALKRPLPADFKLDRGTANER